MSHDILARLEAVAARLEGYASAVASGGVVSSSSSGSSDTIPREVEDFDAFYQDAVVPFIEAAKKSKDTEEIAAWAEQSFQFVRRAIFASKQCKKPTDNELKEFVAPLAKVTESCQKCSRKVPNNHAKAVPEAIGSTSWITQGGNARQFCQDQLEAADFWLIKIMKEGKENNKPEFTEFATKLKQLLQKQKTFVDENFRQGLEWNPKGCSLSSFKDSGSASTHGHGDSGAGAPPPPPGPPGDISGPPGPPGPPPPTGDYAAKPSSGGTAGMGAVFAELTGKGDGVTCGLKRVTKEDKLKLKAAPVLEAKKKADCAPAKKWGAGETKTAEVKKEPKLYLAKGTWFVEHYEGGSIEVPNVQLKENVYIMKCKNVNINIPDKCKSIQIDGCVRTHVTFRSVVSLAEIFNSQRCAVECSETVPSVAIDKSAGCQIILSRAGAATPPDIITSSVSELNLVVPGKTDEDDPVEIPLPEQYITKYKGGMTLVTEPVTHGSNG